jgi:hypothetical protein
MYLKLPITQQSIGTPKISMAGLGFEKPGTLNLDPNPAAGITK